MVSQERSLPFIKNLASSDRKLRDQSLASLRTFLSARRASSALTLLDALKLWKGLFYALWMADRPAPQQALCNDLAGLLDHFDEGTAVRVWLAAFWATMAREWTGIDVLRMEKFLLLVRRVLEAELRYMRRDGGGEPAWDAGRADEVLASLRAWPLSTRENINDEDAGLGVGPDEAELLPPTVPAGLKLHVLDVWVDEADKVGLLASGDAQAAEILRRINGVVEDLHRGTTTTSVKVRSREAMADERLPWNVGGGGIEGHGGEDEDEADDADWDGFND
ncbi:uncharacterized protein E0L32_007741 [Thyridium curvatum]|uniref:Ribosomal RNA-processing protein 1 n=1 Tax=Thyridium curvatum TaxID=1093900 RepID=A0A507B4K4_9PEZI|nr:uncharacterized protein E0L32_007741 [Thyridium curvatum]TPX11530.1 hypothetical protein E0L32_007741 [Thyridium curvatum]